MNKLQFIIDNGNKRDDNIAAEESTNIEGAEMATAKTLDQLLSEIETLRKQVDEQAKAEIPKLVNSLRLIATNTQRSVLSLLVDSENELISDDELADELKARAAKENSQTNIAELFGMSQTKGSDNGDGKGDGKGGKKDNVLTPEQETRLKIIADGHSNKYVRDGVSGEVTQLRPEVGRWKNWILTNYADTTKWDFVEKDIYDKYVEDEKKKAAEKAAKKANAA